MDLGEGRGNFGGYDPPHCKVYGENMVSCREMADPICMRFGTKTLVGQGNHVFVGGMDPPREGAILGGHVNAQCTL